MKEEDLRRLGDFWGRRYSLTKAEFVADFLHHPDIPSSVRDQIFAFAARDQPAVLEFDHFVSALSSLDGDGWPGEIFRKNFAKLSTDNGPGSEQSLHEVIAGVTHFELEEIAWLEERFWERCDQQALGMPAATFASCLLSRVKRVDVVDRIFRSFCEHGHSSLGFKEYVCGLSSMCRGPEVERMKYVARIWDADSDGTLSPEDLSDLFGYFVVALDEFFFDWQPIASTDRQIIDFVCLVIANPIIKEAFVWLSDQIWMALTTDLKNSLNFAESQDQSAPGPAPIATLPGIRNIGNTCYMGAALQILSNVAPLTGFVLSRQRSCFQWPLVHDYAKLLNVLFVSKRNATPRDLKDTISKRSPLFGDYCQHDSQEFIQFFLDALHDDLGQIARMHNGRRIIAPEKEEEGTATTGEQEEGTATTEEEDGTATTEEEDGAATTEEGIATTEEEDRRTATTEEEDKTATSEEEDGTATTEEGIATTEEEDRTATTEEEDRTATTEEGIATTEEEDKTATTEEDRTLTLRKVRRSAIPGEENGPAIHLRIWKEATKRWEKEMVCPQKGSIVLELFAGQLLSRLHCPSCQHSSNCLDLFTVLQLPIPTLNNLVVVVKVLRKDCTTARRHAFRISASAKPRHIKRIVAERINVDFDQLVTLVLGKSDGKYKPMLSRLFDSGGSNADGCENTLKCIPLDDLDLWCVETDAHASHLICVHRRIHFKRVYAVRELDGVVCTTFGVPIVLTFQPKTQIVTADLLYKRIWDYVQRHYQNSVKHPSRGSRRSNMTNRAQDAHADSRRYPFELAITKEDATWCHRCDWRRFCRGCPIGHGGEQLSLGLEQLATDNCLVTINWHNIAALYLLYNNLTERVENDPSMAECTRDSRLLTIRDCFEDFTREESIGDSRCDNCKQPATRTKQLSLARLPPVLIVNFKRFVFVRSHKRFVKQVCPIAFPLDDFDPSPHFAPEVPSEYSCSRYNCIGIVTHQGQLDFGHYCAYVRDSSGNWFFCNDDSTNAVGKGDVDTRDAYIVVYQRRGQGQT